MRIRSSFVGIVLGVTAVTPALAQVPTVSQLALAPMALSLGQVVPTPAQPVELHGVVVDERGQALPGAVVSALGATSAFAVSDRDGRFTFRDLPPGSYLVRAHLQGYLQARGRIVQVAARDTTTSTIELTRRPAADAPSVVAAAVGADAGETPADAAEDRHEHDEVAWRLRHLRRSVLKEAGNDIDLLDDDSVIEDSLASLGHAVEGSARLASALFTDLSLSGQVNLLTTTSFDHPQDLFSLSTPTPRSVAYLSLSVPASDGEWTMRGTVTQGDLASWLLAGSFVRDEPAAHAYRAGVSYGMQRYFGANGEALSTIPVGSRSVGAVYALDDWTVNPRLRVTYGSKYARYDYLADRGLLSPRASVTLQPSEDDNLTVTTSVSHREVAPGAEEFLPPGNGVWLPPERTFAQVSMGAFLPERHDVVQVAVEREWPGDLVLGVRAFRERVADQITTVFGSPVGDAPAEVGHYQVGSAGDFDARGWGVSLHHSAGDHLRTTLVYTESQATWRRQSSDAQALAALAASVLRGDERIHDLTASVEGFVSPTATRVLIVYKLNSALAAHDALATTPTAGVRFDVQVNQALPFLNFTSAQWEMLVAVSNLFRDELFDGSTYDELLVVRPPKRVLGGVTVRF